MIDVEMLSLISKIIGQLGKSFRMTHHAWDQRIDSFIVITPNPGNLYVGYPGRDPILSTHYTIDINRRRENVHLISCLGHRYQLTETIHLATTILLRKSRTLLILHIIPHHLKDPPKFAVNIHLIRY